jgi:isoleucyl-tRNA synthetase
MLAMSTVLENTNPFETALGYALMRDHAGREMHKSWGNLIPFDEAADRAGADVMRWLFSLHNPETNLNFGWEELDEVKRRLLVLWNTYSFFVTYANVDGWSPDGPAAPVAERALLDRWVLARLNQVTAEVRAGLDEYDAMNPARAIERFIEDLSTWYVRRSRRRFWKAENDADKFAAYATLYECLTTLTRLLAPFMPFLSEALYQNLVREAVTEAPLSVHLTDFPAVDVSAIDRDLLEAMDVAQRVVALGRAARDQAKIKIRQPLQRMYVTVPTEGAARDVRAMQDIILEELNVKELELAGREDEFVSYSVRPNLPVLGPRFGKQVPLLRAALEALNPSAVAQSVERGEAVQVELDSQAVELQPGDILVSAREREGYASMAASGFVVVLDTTLTPALVREGLARDVVRRINDWRKAAGLNIDDRIVVRYEADPELAEAIEEHRAYVAQETLALSLTQATTTGAGFTFEAHIGDQRLVVEFERTAMTPSG